jgi:hypothetical protein
MAQVGRFVTDPKAGSYCRITLESGEKILVNHDKSRLTIELSKLFGLSADRLFACDLGTPIGQEVLSRLTRGAQPGTADATPLGALVKYVKDCGTAADVKARCDALATSASALS